jgi:hypothetical protein
VFHGVFILHKLHTVRQVSFQIERLSKIDNNRKMGTEKREKTGGRQKGTPNRTTAEIRSRLQDFVFKTLEEEIDKNDGWSSDISTKDKLDFIAKILPLILSRPTANDITGEGIK